MTLYDILGLSPTASPEEIKKRYKTLAQRTHPDKQGEIEAFQQIAFAYSVLKDAAKRKRYDETGETAELPEPVKVARASLLQMLLHFAEQPGDTVKAVKEHIQNAALELNRQQQAIEKTLSHLKEEQKRFTYKGDGDDFISSAFDYKIGQQQLQLKGIEEAREQGKTMLALLKEYDYKAPKGSPSPTMAQRGGWTRIT